MAIPIVNKYDYQELKRTTLPNGSRTYVTPNGTSVPSVTTILSKTKDMTFLKEWKKRVGEKEAKKITQRSVSHGTTMHKNLENYILEGKEPEGNIFAVAMTKKIIKHGLPNITEVWGTEVPLYADSLYAGTTDLVGCWKGKPAIIDFKNSRKEKKKEWVEDYGLQTAAYALAHNEMFGTEINTGVILLCTHNGTYQEFIFEDDEFLVMANKWAGKVTEYYSKYR